MENRLIYDIGMHMGEDAAFYLAKGFEVVGIEANPDLCAAAEQRLASFRERLHVVNAAVHDEPGMVTFYVNEKVSVWGTTQKQWAERNARLGTRSREIVVPAMKLQDIIAKHGMPYYMKIDIEGSDTICLDALRDFDERPPYVSIESATTFEGVFSELSKLYELGYRRFNLVPQHTVPKQVCPNPPKEGNYVPHRFALGSSGLFGRELPGQWLTLEQTFERFRWILRRYKLLGESSPLRQLGPVRAAANLNRTSPHETIRKAYRATRAALGAVGLRPSHYDTHAMLA
ncbi:MAG TPA: FkbM family methyltransferase [Gammaproteobacteria bacterium]